LISHLVKSSAPQLQQTHMLLLKRGASSDQEGGLGLKGRLVPSWGLADPVVAAPSSAVAVLKAL
jgi:hypothetical protein